MLTIISLEVFCRYVLNTTLMVGIQEIAKWSFVWLSAMGCSALVYLKGHVAVDYFVSTFLSKENQHRVDILGQVFLLIFLFCSLWTGFPYAIRQWHRFSTSAELPTTIVFICIPVAFCFMGVHVISNLTETIEELRRSGSGQDNRA